MSELEEKIIEELTVELSKDADFDSDVLAIKVKNAIREFKSARGYNSNIDYYTEAMIEQDLMDNYYSDILGLALYDYNIIGGEGQTSHSEEDVSRHYVDRNSYFRSVVKIALI